MAQARKPAALRRAPTKRSRTGTAKGAKIAVTVRLDTERVRQLQSIADVENGSHTNYVETALLCDLASREEVDHVCGPGRANQHPAQRCYPGRR